MEIKKWVRLKSPKELVEAGFKISHISDDGEFIRFGKGGTEIGIWQNDEPRLVVNHNTVHENLLKIFPDAFEEVRTEIKATDDCDCGCEYDDYL